MGGTVKTPRAENCHDRDTSSVTAPTDETGGTRDLQDVLPDPANHTGPSCPRGLLAFAALCATVGALIAASLGALDGLSSDARDGLVKARNAARPAPSSVVLVEVDPKTVFAQGQSLPLDRSVYAETIDRLTTLGVRAIAIDVQFTEPSGNPASDEELLVAVEDSEVPVVLATSEVLPGGDTGVLGGRQNLDPAGAVAAHSGLRVDYGERAFAIDPEVHGIPSFAQAAANAVGAPGIPHRGTLIDPTVPATKLNRVSLQTLIGGSSIDRAAFDGKIAVIGVTAVGPRGGDTLSVIGSEARMPGVAVQAQAIDTALRGEPLRDAGRWPAYVAALIIGLLAVLGATRRLGLQLIVAVAVLLGLAAVSIIAAKLGVLVDPIPAVVALLLGSLGAMAVRAESERRRRAAARATLGRFVPPGVVDELLEDDRDGRIAPQGQEATVVFCDLRGYTSLVAGLKDPAALIAILDTYLAEVTETVHRHGGTVVSFQGDGVMSAFGTPVPTPESAAQAVAAARELQERALPRVRERLAEIVDGAEKLRLGVGVATGPVFAGTVGPAERREYAVVGPTTNLAARLQALTKTEGVDVILDDRTASTGADGALLRLGSRDIRGLERPIDVWTVVSTRAPLAHAA